MWIEFADKKDLLYVYVCMNNSVSVCMYVLYVCMYVRTVGLSRERRLVHSYIAAGNHQPVRWNLISGIQH